MTVTEFRKAFASLPDGWLTEDEALLLVDYASRTTGRIVEFGNYLGRSACLLGRLYDDPHWTADTEYRAVQCVDPWGDFGLPQLTGNEVFSRFKSAVVDLPNVVIFRGRVEDWEPAPAGFVYCDGDHSYEGTLAQVRKALACDPQVIAAHDVNDTGGGVHVKRACLELLGPWTERVGRLAVWDRESAVGGAT